MEGTRPMQPTGTTRFLHKLRLRVFAVLTAVILAAVAVISLGVWPVPVVSVALLTAAAVLNTMTSKLAVSVCSGCGEGLGGVPTGAYGAVCPSCGTINSALPAGWDSQTRLAFDDEPSPESSPEPGDVPDDSRRRA
ncbi:MAG: hypothetical protein ACI89L_001038 [Phycisphaerales bacterium]|jgi:hypothetical protein